jgi:hypothetical protein
MVAAVRLSVVPAARHPGRPVVDEFSNIASAVVRSAVDHEYLPLVRTRAGWKIVIALWQWTDQHRRW